MRHACPWSNAPFRGIIRLRGTSARQEGEELKTGNGKKILVICYGNPAREDDAIGPSIAEDLEKLNLSGIAVDSDYQLTVEDAALVAEHDVVIFVDASLEG